MAKKRAKQRQDKQDIPQPLACHLHKILELKASYQSRSALREREKPLGGERAHKSAIADVGSCGKKTALALKVHVRVRRHARDLRNARSECNRGVQTK